ncbi:MAG: HlyD family efflux transporter periplasmic adaptor subunit [Clostridiaceae bacterium]|nr:HlyD family efflux transporter periplasmic adaptor subunit [Clostridiaceae bacterium]
MEKIKSFFSFKAVKIGLIIIIVAGLTCVGYMVYSKITSAAASKNAVEASTVTVTRGNIEVKISGTGTVQPISRYDIVPLVKGTILSAPFEEGMQVKAGDLLYRIDDSDLSFNIEKSKNSIEKAKLDYEAVLESIKNLQVYAPCDGKITDFNVREGDELGNNTKIANIINDSQLTATISFTASQLEQIYVGQPAQLIVPQYMTQIDGTVSNINYTPKAGAGGAVLYDVEITVNNPGSVTEGTLVNGVVKGASGDIISPVASTVKNIREESLVAKTSGKVKKVYVSNNQWVKAGQKIIELENEELYVTKTKSEMNLRDQELSLEAQLKQLNDYNIVSPIDGTVITKNAKVGDNINNAGNSNNVLMTIADLSKMIFTISVDELDIANVKLGQKVRVTADALPGEEFEGEITNIPAEGTSQNGVTTYPVEVTIASPGDLKPGMNVNAEIVVQSKENVLLLPVAAVTKMNNKYFVYVPEKTEGRPTGNSEGNNAPDRERRRRPDGDANNTSGQAGPRGFQSGERQERSGNTGERQGEQRAEGGRNNAFQNAQGGMQRTGSFGRNNSMPAMSGRKRVEVVVGINNEDFIEIVSGLNEGDIVYMPTVSSNSGSNNNNNVPAMNRIPVGGGMPGGGMPGGGMPGGGMPGGGMPGGRIPGGGMTGSGMSGGSGFRR